MAGFKSAAKRKRELAKLEKRNAKDQKRAVRKAERARADVTVPEVLITASTQHKPAGQGAAADTGTARKPLSLAEAVERWKTTKVGNSTTRPPGARSSKRS